MLEREFVYLATSFLFMDPETMEIDWNVTSEMVEIDWDMGR